MCQGRGTSFSWVPRHFIREKSNSQNKEFNSQGLNE